jgi:nitroreductase
MARLLRLAIPTFVTQVEPEASTCLHIGMSIPDDWQAFLRIVSSRRAIRDFDGRPLNESVVREVLTEALKAPSSGNIQPYQFHWVKDSALKAKVASACNSQRAASSASALVVVVSSKQIAEKSLAELEAELPRLGLDEKGNAYHSKGHVTLRRFLRFAPLVLLEPLLSLAAWFAPVLTLLPFGPSGMRHWFTRNSIYAVQALLLGAAARGLDTCPMEGFNAVAVARLLKLPRGSVIPVVIALGYRQANARVEPQQRRSFAHAVVIH